jgi:hypothetical protein
MKSNDHEVSLQHSVLPWNSIVGLQFFNGKRTSCDTVLFKSTITCLVPATLSIWERKREIKWESWSQHSYSCHWRYYCSVMAEGRGHLSSCVRMNRIIESQAGCRRRWNPQWGIGDPPELSNSCGAGFRAPSLPHPAIGDISQFPPHTLCPDQEESLFNFWILGILSTYDHIQKQTAVEGRNILLMIP